MFFSMFLNKKIQIINSLHFSHTKTYHFHVTHLPLERQFLENSSGYWGGSHYSMLLCKITFSFGTLLTLAVLCLPSNYILLVLPRNSRLSPQSCSFFHPNWNQVSWKDRTSQALPTFSLCSVNWKGWNLKNKRESLISWKGRRLTKRWA